MFEKILIANRGEIALRIHRACKEMGIATVAVHSTADEEAMHVRLADESVCIGPPPAKESYLNIPAILAACEITGADAVHPGYGFLSENAHFAEILGHHGIRFIGPSPEHIRLMGDKIAAKQIARKLNLPLVPGSEGAVKDVAEALDFAKRVNYPVLVKAAAGGGGRGMKVVRRAPEMAGAMSAAAAEAKAAFGDGTLYLEKYLNKPRHIEVQLLGDPQGRAIHLGERDCSLQRRHQKILEEAPSPALNEKDRERIGRLAARAATKLGYIGAGTMEFLYTEEGFFFIEMNTRLQVEHPVTEMITGVNMVREQIMIAAGASSGIKQRDIRQRGHAVECRINAENARTFLPSPGEVRAFHPPGGFGVRVDSSVYEGYRIPAFYDSMIGKLIIHGQNRTECLMRLRWALKEFVIEGVDTTIPLFQELLEEADIINGNYDIHWLESWIAKRQDNPQNGDAA